MARTKNFNEEETLEKAMELFWKKGYKGTSIKDLVEYLGIQRSSIYTTYGDKLSFFQKAVQQYRKGASQLLMDKLQEDKPAKTILRELFDLTIQEIMGDPSRKGCFMVNLTTEIISEDTRCDEDRAAYLAMEEIVNANRQNIERAFQALILRGQAEGEISTRHEAQALSRYLLNVINGIRVLAKTNASEEVFRDIVAVTLSTLE